MTHIDYTQMSDEEICNCENKKDKFRYGFEVLHKRYNAKLLSKCRYKFPNAEADEIVQETWLKVFLYLQTKNNLITNFKGVLYKSFDYSCKEYLRNSIKMSAFEKSIDIELLTSDEKNTREHEKYELVMSILNSIPSNRKEQFLLRYQDQCSWQQISQIFNTSSDSIRKYCERIKKQIQSLIQKSVKEPTNQLSSPPQLRQRMGMNNRNLKIVLLMRAFCLFTPHPYPLPQGERELFV